jgi:hypothetical protein
MAPLTALDIAALGPAVQGLSGSRRTAQPGRDAESAVALSAIFEARPLVLLETDEQHRRPSASNRQMSWLRWRSAVPPPRRTPRTKDHPGTPTAGPHRARRAAARHRNPTKLLTHACRIAAYNAESALARLVAPHYARANDEARSLIREALSCAGDIHLDHGHIHVTLNPLSAPRRTRALAAICELLNDRNRLPRHRPRADLQRQTPPRHHMNFLTAPRVLDSAARNRLRCGTTVDRTAADAWLQHAVAGPLLNRCHGPEA